MLNKPAEKMIKRKFRKCSKERTEEAKKVAELIKEINKESLTTYKNIKISDTEYEATMVINSPLDLSLDKCMKGSDPWILQSNKPARIFFVLLQQIDYLNKKGLCHGNLRLSSIYVHDRLVYSAYWGLAKLDRILEGGETDLFDKDMTDFRSIAMAILDKIGDQSIGKKEFLGLLERKATLEELLKSTFIENAYFPTMDDEFKRLCAAGYDEIGSGASGSVVRIREGNQYFAIKQVNFKPEELETVRKEALMQKRASENCMYIARYYGFWIEKNATKDGDTLSLFIKMEYCETPLFKSLHSRPLEEKLTYIKPLLLGTKSIHEKNIVHGDLKTDNIFISDTLKIADFGVSKSDGEKKKDLQNLAHIIYELYTERVTDDNNLCEEDLDEVDNKEVRGIIETLYKERAEEKYEIDTILEKYDQFFKECELNKIIAKSAEREKLRGHIADSLFNFYKPKPELKKIEFSWDYDKLKSLETYIKCIEIILKTHGASELEQFPFDSEEATYEDRFMTKDGKVHNFRTTPHSFFLECMKRKTIKQQIRCFSIGPSYEEAFWKPDTKEELDKLENNHMIVAEYDIAAPFSESSEYEQRTFYLFELLRVLKSCVMTEREDDFSIVLRDPIITMDELKQYLFDPENRESNQTCIDIKKSIEVEEYRPGDYDEGFSFEAKVNKVLVAIGKELPRDDDTEFVAFGFEIFINNLLGITEEKKYQGASTWATDKKVIITIPPECFPLKVLDVARNLRKKDFFAEVIPCYEVMPKFDDNIEVVGYNESEFSEQINRAKVKVTKEKKTAAAKRIAIEKTEPYDIIIDPHLEDEGLKKEDVFKQVESKFKYLYYKDVTIAAVNYEAKDLKQGIYSNQIKVDYLLKTKDIKRTVIFITYSTNEDGSKNFDKPDFFLWVNHNFCITQKPQPSAQKTERKKK